MFFLNKYVFFPTNNIGKFDRYKKSFEKNGILYRRYYKDIKVDVIEDEESLVENAKKKAKAYYSEYKKYLKEKFLIMTTDEALYIDGLNDEEQPGIYVRRFDGLNRAEDQEVIDKYTSFVKKMGGEVRAKWVYSLIVFDGKNYYDYSWDEIVLFGDTLHLPITKGYVLNNITIVKKENNKNIMLSDLSDEERYNYLAKYTDKVCKFVIDKL